MKVHTRVDMLHAAWWHMIKKKKPDLGRPKYNKFTHAAVGEVVGVVGLLLPSASPAALACLPG